MLTILASSDIPAAEAVDGMALRRCHGLAFLWVRKKELAALPAASLTPSRTQNAMVLFVLAAEDATKFNSEL